MDLQQRIELTHQTLDALEAINNNGRKVPEGHLLWISSDGRDWLHSGYPHSPISGELHYRLTPIPQPRRVPLTLADVPPGSVFSFDTAHGWLSVDVFPGGIVYRSGVQDVSRTWKELMDKNCQIHRPGGTWQPCWKEVTE